MALVSIRQLLDQAADRNQVLLLEATTMKYGLLDHKRKAKAA